jgi:hypothetical protein
VLIVYNSNSDWMPAIIYLQIFSGILACMQAIKQISCPSRDGSG